jgi:signal-transduction protein with cAMP-binding, CBS, and nucleotidyltransferase domain
MRCPTCGFENLLGSDICDNCGSDLAGRDVPEQAVSFRGQLLGEHLDDLGIVPAEIVDADADIDVAIQRMHDKGIDCVLVVDDGRFVGIFTDRDAVLKVGSTVGDRRPLREAMTPDPVVLRRDDPVAVAIHKMAIGGFRHVPIVDDGHPIGVVSAKDVFRHLAAGLA